MTPARARSINGHVQSTRVPLLRGRRINQMLVALGLPRDEIYALHKDRHRKPFWERYDEYELHDILVRAHDVYRRRMRSAHPDHGGSVDEATMLNSCWRHIVHLFAKRGVRL